MNDARSALIGYTGFVGSNLVRQHSFDAMFNSQNIDSISGRSPNGISITSSVSFARSSR